MPKSSYPQRLSFFSVPAALLVIAADDGERQIFPTGWVGVVCSSPCEVMIWLPAKTVEKGLLRAGSPFAVEWPAEEALWSLTEGLRQGRSEGKFVSGMTPLASFGGTTRGYPLTADSSVRIECRCRSLATRFGQFRLCGEILAIYLEGRRQEVPAALDLCRLLPVSLQKRQGCRSEA